MSSMEIDKSMPVLVTGATGYVAGWIVKRLLEEGVTVHAAVRDPDDRKKIRHLEELAAGLPGTLRFFKAVPMPRPWTAAASCSTPPRRSP